MLGANRIGTFSAGQLCKVAGFIVGLSVLPAFPKNTDPFEGQGAENDGMFLTFFDHSFVVDFSPRRIAHGLTGPLDKGLPQESWGLPPPMCPELIAALFPDGGDSDQFLHAGGVGLERTNCPEGDAEPWS